MVGWSGGRDRCLRKSIIYCGAVTFGARTTSEDHGLIERVYLGPHRRFFSRKCSDWPGENSFCRLQVIKFALFLTNVIKLVSSVSIYLSSLYREVEKTLQRPSFNFDPII
jgi:hypothetical protein